MWYVARDDGDDLMDSFKNSDEEISYGRQNHSLLPNKHFISQSLYQTI